MAWKQATKLGEVMYVSHLKWHIEWMVQENKNKIIVEKLDNHVNLCIGGVQVKEWKS